MKNRSLNMLKMFCLSSSSKTQTLPTCKPMDVYALKESSNITSIRLINRVMEEVCAAMPSLRAFKTNITQCDQWSQGWEYSFHHHHSCGGVAGRRSHLLSDWKFQDAVEKAVYQICVKVLNLCSLAGVLESRLIISPLSYPSSPFFLSLPLCFPVSFGASLPLCMWKNSWKPPESFPT